MHKKTAGLLLGSAFLAIACFSAFSFVKNKQEVKTVEAYYTPSTHYEVSDTASELASYYSSASGKTGNALLAELQSINSTRRKRTVGYSTMGTSSSDSPYVYTDYPLGTTTKDSNNQIRGTSVASFYTKTTSDSFNKEHVWPNSHGGDNVEADILHTRPTISSENSSRGNSFYVEGMNNSTNGWDPYTAGYAEWCRGECARIILYSVVAYSGFSLSDLNVHSTTNANPDNMMGNMNTLIKWHFAYTPNEYEMNRNNGAEYLQGNRNPFVDHPEYVAMIWSNFNSTVSTLCSNNSSVYSNWTPGTYSTYGTNDASGGQQETGVSISSTALSVGVSKTATISATSSNSSNITWTTSDASVASISKTTATSGEAITITGVAVGTATLTAKATINSTLYTKTCTVTVSELPDYSIVPTDLANNAYPTSATSYTTADGLAIKAYNTANYSSKIQFKKSGGYIYNTSSLNLSSIKINGISGSVTVYGGSSQNPSSTTITASSGVYNLTGYNYFKIINSSSSVATADSIEVYLTTKTLSSISVSTAPTKTTYTAGEYFDPTGLVITRNYTNPTSSDTYTYANHTSEFTFNPNTSTALTTSNTSVTITYGGKSTTQAITVNAAAKTLSSISVSGQTTSFTVGDTFSFGGTVTATFSDSSTANVTSSSTFSGYNMNTAGTQTVTVSYTYSGTTKTTTYTITVTSSGGSQTESYSQRIVSKSDSTYFVTGSIYPTGDASSGTATCNAFDVSWLKNDGNDNLNYTYAEIRIYAKHSFTITPKTNYTITSIVITANSSSYANAVGGSSLTNCTKAVNSSTVTLTPTNGTSAVGFTNSAQSRINYIVVNYDGPAGSSSGGNDLIPTTQSLTSGSPYINGIPYKLYHMYNSSKNYFNGEMSGNYYGKTTTNITNAVDIYFEQNNNGQNMFFISNSAKQYITLVTNNSYKNFSFSETTPTTPWIYSSSEETLTYSLSGVACYMGADSSHDTFTGNNVTYKAQLISSNSAAATVFSTLINEKITCDSTGTNAPSIASGFSWTAFNNIYANLDGDVSTSGTSKYILKNTSANPSGDTIAQFVARYDYIVGKYGSSTYTDFLGRNPSRLAGFRIPLFESIISKDNSIIIVIVSTAITALAVGGYFFFRRKKDTNV